MRRLNWFGVVLGIMVVGFMMPIVVAAQEGAHTTFSDYYVPNNPISTQGTEFESHDEGFFTATFSTSGGGSFDIVNLGNEGFINDADPLLCIRGSDSLSTVFSGVLADLSVQVSILKYNTSPVAYIYDEASIPTVPDVEWGWTIKSYLGDELGGTAEGILNIQDPGCVENNPDNLDNCPVGYYHTIGPCGFNDDCPTVFPQGFDKVEIEFTREGYDDLIICVDNFFGNPKQPNNSACDSLQGAAYGLCTAYCEAMDCDGDPQASEMACNRVLNNYMRVTDGEVPPCS